MPRRSSLGHDAQVDLQATFEQDAAACLALFQHALYIFICSQTIHDRAWVLSRHKQIEVAYRLAPATQAAGRDRFAHAWRGAQIDQECLGHRLHIGPLVATVLL